ncbi:hypothetical protein [Vibrio vulnificus YJ016]|uniref:Uncharacterized protein n=1 Tax=Vibrio vulnificus (strain YJ016) TaxID=196600 RepID=Q7MIH4_VIBVY|nr:hypothetical protein [Vibrio vulnificus YJ016]
MKSNKAAGTANCLMLPSVKGVTCPFSWGKIGTKQKLKTVSRHV